MYSDETIILKIFRNNGTKSVVLKSVDGLAVESVFGIGVIGQGNLQDSKAGMGESGRLQVNVQVNPGTLIEFKVTVNSR